MKQIALSVLFVFAGSINIFAQTTPVSTLSTKSLKTIAFKESTSKTTTDKDPRPQTQEITPASLQDPTNVKTTTDPAVTSSTVSKDPATQDKSTPSTQTTKATDKTTDEKADKKADRKTDTATQKTALSALAATASAANNDTSGSPVPSLNSLSVAVQPFTGSASLPVNISVPAGRGGIQPSVALVYNSELPESFVGVGWNLDLGSIQRSTKKGPPKYNSSDTFVLIQNGSSSNLVWDAAAAMYRQEIEGAFAKITSTGSGAAQKWIMTDKKGTKYYFGQSAVSQEVDPADGAKIFSWALDRVEDLNGNYMTITYIKASNMLYPSTINYTGNSQTPVIAPFAKVVFNYTDVARTLTSYKRSFLVNSTKLLDNVSVYANNALLTKYKFNYQQSVSSKRYLLGSVVQYGANGTSALPAVTFTYQGDVKGFNYESDWAIPGGFSFTGSGNEVDAGIRIADINADAYPDLVRAYTGCINSTASTLLNTKSRGFLGSSSWIYPTNVVAGFINYCGSVDFRQHPLGTLLADVDGDLWTDVIRNYVNKNGIPTIQSELSNKVGGFADSAPWKSPADTPVIWEAKNTESLKEYQGVNYVDVNGDGFADIVISRNTPTVNHNVYINQAVNGGTGWVLDPSWTTPSDPNADLSAGATLADLNGDGLPDIIYMAGGPTATVFMNNGHGWNAGPTPWDSVPQQWSGVAEGVAQLGDINGDGLVDVIVGQGSLPQGIVPTNGYGLVMINTGSGWYDDNSWSAPIGSFSTLDTRLLDANADGVVDYMGALPGMGTDARMSINKSKPADLLVKINNGLGVTTDIAYESSAHYTNTFLPFVVQVVKSVTVSMGSESYNTGYYYSGGLWAADTREFRGFGTVTVYDPDGNNVKTTYLQDRIYKGMVSSAETYDLHGVFINKTVNTWDKKTLVAGDASVFPFVRRVDNYLYDSVPGRRTAQEFFYDEAPQYGNLTKTIEYGEVIWGNGADMGSDERITKNTYVNNPSLWILGLPSIVDVTTNYVQLGETEFYYDNSTSLTAVPTKGQLTKRYRWAGSGLPATAHPVDTFVYDAVGNLTKTTDPMGNSTTIAYDPLKLFPLTTTNALGHVVKTEYYGVNGVALSDTTGFAGLWGQVKSVTDVNNQKASRVYDTFGRMTKSISPLDSITYPTSSTDYFYGSNFLRVTSHARRTSGQAPTIDSVSYYDGLGRLIQSKSPTATAGQYVVSGQTLYNTRGLPMYRYISRLTTNPLNTMDPIVTTDPKAMTSYDGMGRVTRSTHPDGTFVTTDYLGWVTVQNDERGARTDFTHDAYGRVIMVVDYTGYEGWSPTLYPASPHAVYSTTTYAYDGDGKLTSVTDVKGNKTTITYDGLGRKTSMIDPDMKTWVYTYDVNGNLLTQKDAKGQIITFTYDALNRLKTKTSGTALNVVYTYDDTTNSGYAKGRLSNVTYTGGSTQFVYDVLGRETQSTKTIDGNPYTVKRVYDSLNNVTQITYPDLSTVFYQYNSIGQLQAVSNSLSVMPPLALNNQEPTTMFAKLRDAILVIARSPEGATKQSDKLHKIASAFGFAMTETAEVIRAKSKEFYASWVEPKVLGIKEAEAAIPATLFVKSIAYNLNGQATTITYGNGTVTTQTYTAPMYRINKIRTVNKAGVVLQDLSYTYDVVGNIRTITDAKNTATQTFTYDYLNRLTQAVNPATGGYGTLNYSYDTLGNIASKEGVNYTYSKVNAGPHAVTSLNNGTTLTYDANGNMATMVKTGDSKAFTYDVENRLIDVKKNGVTLGQYFYDGDGGRTAKIVYKSGQTGNNTCFLGGTKIAMADGSTKSIEEIKVGDLVSSYDVKKMDKVAAKVTEMFDGDTAKEYLLVNGHLKVTPNHQFYSQGKWVEIGKLKEGDLLFDQDGKETVISKIEKVESQNSIQVYNLEVEGEHNYYADGMLVHNKLSYNPPVVSGVPVTAGIVTRYVGALAEETKGAWVNHVFLGATKIATVTSSEVRYYLQDHLGSTNVVTNATGTMIELNEYKPFGEFSKHSQFGTSNAAWYYFTGKPLDDETGLMFYGARYYSPVLGRFITPDTVVQSPNNPQTLNRYSYCNNNPVNHIDSDGHSFWKSAFRAFVGSIIRAVYSAIFAPLGPYGQLLASMMASATTTAVFGGDYHMIGKSAGFGALDWAGGQVIGSTGMAIVDGIKAIQSGQGIGDFAGGFLGSMAGQSVAEGVKEMNQTNDDKRDSSTAGKVQKMNAAKAPLSKIEAIDDFVKDLVGKAWASPNTAFGLALGVVGAPFVWLAGQDVYIESKDNAINLRFPWGPGGAITFGNVVLYNGTEPGDWHDTYDGTYTIDRLGNHEGTHTYQYQKFGFTYGLFYLTNDPFTQYSPFERQADIRAVAMSR